VSRVHDKLRELPNSNDYTPPPIGELHLVPPGGKPIPKMSVLGFKLNAAAVSFAVIAFSGLGYAGLHYWAARFHKAEKPAPVETSAQMRQKIDLGNPGATVATLEATLKLDPKNTTALINLAYAQKVSGHPDQAESLLKKALEVKPDNPVALNNLARLNASVGKWAQAIELYQKALAIDHTYTDATLNLATAYEASKDWTHCISEYEVFLQIDHQYPDLHPIVLKRLRLLRAFDTYSQNHKDKA
jgi:tetratricopeptide (TPR) repeat protein